MSSSLGTTTTTVLRRLAYCHRLRSTRCSSSLCSPTDSSPLTALGKRPLAVAAGESAQQPASALHRRRCHLPPLRRIDRTFRSTAATRSRRGSGGPSSNGDGDGGGDGAARVWEISAGAAATATEASSSSSREEEGGAEEEEGSEKGACFVARSSEDAGGAGGGWVEETRTRQPPDAAASAGGGEQRQSAAAPRPPPPSRGRVERYLRHNVLRHFLPAGYPATVSPSYLPYASHCFVASSCGSASFVISTQALLLAVGVGSADAAPVAAALNWVLKDGMGQLGGVLFASRLGSGTIGGGSGTGGSTIDSDPKRWRMVAALALDSATFLEILCPLFPGYFLPIASIANVGKNIGFLAAGASRAAVHQSLARSSNLGDITAKAGSQSIAASLVGTGMGLALSPLVGGDVMKVAAGFAVLSACHQFCNYRALRSVALDTLNRHRLNLILDRFLLVAREAEEDAPRSGERKGEEARSELGKTGEGAAVAVATRSAISSPAEVAEDESFLPFLSPDDSASWLSVGCGLVELCPGGPEQLRRLQMICCVSEGENGVVGDDDSRRRCRYILNCDVDEAGAGRARATAIRLVFLEGADGRDIVRGMVHAHVLRKTPVADLEAFVSRRHCIDGEASAGGTGLQSISERVISASRMLSSKYTPGLVEGLDAQGWRVTDGSVCVEGGAAGRRLRIQL